MIWTTESVIALFVALGGFMAWLIFIANKAGKVSSNLEHIDRNMRLLSRRMGSMTRHVGAQNGRVGKLENRVDRLEDDATPPIR